MSPPEVLSEDPEIDPTYLSAQADYHFTLGEALSLDGDSDKSIEEFKLALVYKNSAAPIILRLASEYLKKGLLTESLEYAEQASKIEPENVEVAQFMGGLYSAMKMYSEAQEKYELVAKLEPENKEILLYLGALNSEQEKFADAEKYFIKATKGAENEKAHLAYYYLAKMQASRGAKFYNSSELNFTKSLQEKPDFDDSALALAELYSLQKNREKAYRLLESFQEQYGPKKNVAYQLSQMYLEENSAEEVQGEKDTKAKPRDHAALYSKALKHLKTLESFEPNNLNIKVKIVLILIEQKSYDEAIKNIETVLRLAPDADKFRFYLAAIYEETEKYDLAISNFKKIGSASSYFSESVVHAAYLYRKTKDLDSAADLLKNAIAEKNDVPQFYSFYASILDEKKDFKKSINLLESALKKFPENAQLHFYLGSAYDRVSRTQDSVEQMRKVLAIDQNHVQALNYLAYSFAESDKNLDEANSFVHRALKLQPNDPYILDTAGWVLFKMHRVDDAIQYLEAAHRLKSDESIIAEHLGDAYYVYELIDKARTMYLQAVKVEVDEEKVNKLRAKIISLETPVARQRVPASNKNNEK